jgi:hypothetical protein
MIITDNRKKNMMIMMIIINSYLSKFELFIINQLTGDLEITSLKFAKELTLHYE